MKTTKKCLSLLLSFVMVLSIACVPVMAEDTTDTATTEKVWYSLSDTPVFEETFSTDGAPDKATVSEGTVLSEIRQEERTD